MKIENGNNKGIVPHGTGEFGVTCLEITEGTFSVLSTERGTSNQTAENLSMR